MAASVCCTPAGGSAHAASDFTARLAPMPVDFRSAKQIVGLGQVHGQLEGSRLVLTGNFHGLAGAATAARLHAGAPAISGPAIATLQVTRSTEGNISGEIELTPQQLANLAGHGLYIQIDSSAAPEGNLRGWLFELPAKN